MLPSLCAPQPGREDLESSFGEQVQPIPPPTPPSRLSGQLEGPESARFYGLIKTLKASLQCPPTTTPTVSLYSLPHTYRISHARIEICQQLSVPCWFLVPVLSAHHLIPVLIFFSSNLYPLKPINLLCLHLLWNCCGFKLNKSSRSNLPLVDDGCRPWWGGERGFDKDALAVVLSADTNMRFWHLPIRILIITVRRHTVICYSAWA